MLPSPAKSPRKRTSRLRVAFSWALVSRCWKYLRTFWAFPTSGATCGPGPAGCWGASTPRASRLTPAARA
eukprot:9370534-Pyramimonas_sp.AAC.1